MTRAGVLLAIAIAVVIGAPAARAETAYRYWSYWQASDGDWSFATLGPASAMPPDGAVEGWRFAITTEQAGAKDAPRMQAAGAFADICGATDPTPGRKRIALVLDFGHPADAPAGEVPPAQVTRCVIAEPDASGYQVLSAAAEVRTDEGLVCGIAGYPRAGCADVVDAADAAGAAGSLDATDAMDGMDARDASAAVTASPSSLSPAATAPALSGGWAMLVSALALLGAAALGTWVWKRRTP